MYQSARLFPILVLVLLFSAVADGVNVNTTSGATPTGDIERYMARIDSACDTAMAWLADLAVRGEDHLGDLGYAADDELVSSLREGCASTAVD